MKLIMENWRQFLIEQWSNDKIVTKEEQLKMAQYIKDGFFNAMSQKISELKNQGKISQEIDPKKVIKIDIGKSSKHKSKTGIPHLYVTILLHKDLKYPGEAAFISRAGTLGFFYPKISDLSKQGKIPDIVYSTYSGYSPASARNFGYGDDWALIENYNIRLENWNHQ